MLSAKVFIAKLAIFILFKSVRCHEINQGYLMITVNCTIQKYSRSDWSVVNGLACREETGSLISNERHRGIIDKVIFNNGTELTKEVLDRIEVIDILNSKNMTTLPKELQNKFPNLKVLALGGSGIKELQREDMERFGNKLTVFDAYRNQIEKIDDDLFNNNFNLKYISFIDNPVKVIGKNFVRNLNKMKKLEQVILINCKCTNDHFNMKDGHELKTFKWNLDNCFPIEEQFSDTKTEKTKIDYPLNSSIQSNYTTTQSSHMKNSNVLSSNAGKNVPIVKITVVKNSGFNANKARVNQNRKNIWTLVLLNVISHVFIVNVITY